MQAVFKSLPSAVLPWLYNELHAQTREDQGGFGAGRGRVDRIHAVWQPSELPYGLQIPGSASLVLC